MKIVEIYTQNIGSVPNGKLSLVNEWTGEVENRVLFTGINGCGKSTLLFAIARIWEMLGDLLENPNEFIPPMSIDWNIAVILEDEDVEQITNKESSRIGLVWGHKKWFKEQNFETFDVIWIGRLHASEEWLLRNDELLKRISEKKIQEIQQYTTLPDKYIPNDHKWFNTWSNKFKLANISNEIIPEFPNMMYLDAEERQWIRATENIGQYLPDKFYQRWLIQYHVSKEWQGQLEHTLINLKLLDEKRFNEIIDSLNCFLKGKAIQKQTNDEVRLIVKADSGEYKHNLDDLSSGERQVLIMLFLMLRWLQKGGIVLIDEPDLYLHPSLVQGFLATLELEAEKLGAQLIITSHSDDVWRRYEDFGVRIDMSGGEYNVR